MKKFLLFFCTVILSLNISAQFFISGFGNYSFPVAKELLAAVPPYAANSSGVYYLGAVYGSFATGFHYGGDAGYYFKKHFYIEAGCDQLIAKTQSTKIYDTLAYPPVEESVSVCAKILNIVPGIGYYFDVKKIRISFSAGMIFGIKGKIYDSTTFINSTQMAPAHWYDSAIEYEGEVGLGIRTKCDLSFLFTKNFSVGIGFNACEESWAPTNGKMIEYKVNGIDQLPGIPVSAKDYIFVNNPRVSSAPTNQPSEQLLKYYPFNCVGISIHAEFLFGYKKTKPENAQ